MITLITLIKKIVDKLKISTTNWYIVWIPQWQGKWVPLDIWFYIGKAIGNINELKKSQLSGYWLLNNMEYVNE